MYATIDETELGHITWHSFTISFNAGEDDNPLVDTPWKRKSYDVWFHDPKDLLKVQLGNHDFRNEMNFAPKEVRNKETKAQIYGNFMSGAWAWRQAVHFIQNVGFLSINPRNRTSLLKIPTMLALASAQLSLGVTRLQSL